MKQKRKWKKQTKMATNNALIWGSTMIILNLIISGTFILLNPDDEQIGFMFGEDLGQSIKTDFSSNILNGEGNVVGINTYGTKINEPTDQLVNKEKETVLEGVDNWLNFGKWINIIATILGSAFGGMILSGFIIGANSSHSIWLYVLLLPLYTINIYYIGKLFLRDRLGA